MELQLIFAMQLQLGFRNETFGENLRGDALGFAAAGVTRLPTGGWTAVGYPQGRGLSAVG
jgi:hypothetical protein